MAPTEPRRVLVAATGGIAAYKVPELVRVLRRGGHEVRCVLTPEAEKFVTPLVLQALSGHPVRSRLFDAAEENAIDHIELADWPDVVVVAPATAHLLARARAGLADDLLTTLLLATRAPIAMAPSMNVNMWQHPATQENVAVLRERGVRIVGPDEGDLACGWQGEGRMSDPEVIAEATLQAATAATLEGRKFVVTAGGTAEALDPVRQLTNRSSGKMGFAIAAEAALRGADVAIVAGPCSLATPHGARRIDVESAEEMRAALLAELEGASVVVKAAAVADFRPRERAERKIKKEELGADDGLTLELVRNPDILAEISRPPRDYLVVGFAAESHDVAAAARRKLERKGCDLIVANDVSRADAGFDVDTNAVQLVWPDGPTEELPLMSKPEVARQLLDRVEKLLQEPRT